MSVPKKRTSKTRKNKRRTHFKLSQPTATECPQCREMKLPHRACPDCGYYRGQKRVEVKE